MATTLFIVKLLATWFLFSLVGGVLVGRFLRVGSRWED